jgi:hypothetical protein
MKGKFEFIASAHQVESIFLHTQQEQDEEEEEEKRLE